MKPKLLQIPTLILIINLFGCNNLSPAAPDISGKKLNALYSINHITQNNYAYTVPANEPVFLALYDSDSNFISSLFSQTFEKPQVSVLFNLEKILTKKKIDLPAGEYQLIIIGDEGFGICRISYPQ